MSVDDRTQIAEGTGPSMTAEAQNSSDHESRGDRRRSLSTASSASGDDVNAPYGLTIPEKNWAEIQPVLLERGYRLRSRYQPGWVGSWVGTKKDPRKCEDSVGIRDDGLVIDAVRIADGEQVILKLWIDEERDAAELPTLRYFSEEPRASDPANHCVPLLDSFEVEGYSEMFDRILVEPLLRDCTYPPFLMLGEALSFFLQALEGLEYMHSHNVAHGDIHLGNILMDPRPLYPKGTQIPFSFDTSKMVTKKGVKQFTRLRAPVKYYYIDFGSSVIFPSAEERKPVAFNAAAFIPPEVRANTSALYDPFKADVFALGLSLLELMRFRSGLEFLIAALENMIAENPDERPSAADATLQFKRAIAGLPAWKMRRKLGWAKDIKVPYGYKHTLGEWRDYARLLWDSYKYGLPSDVLAAKKL